MTSEIKASPIIGVPSLQRLALKQALQQASTHNTFYRRWLGHDEPECCWANDRLHLFSDHFKRQLEARHVARSHPPSTVHGLLSFLRYGGLWRSTTYDEGFWCAVFRARDLILHRPDTSLESLLMCLAYARGKLALKMHTASSNKFGVPLKSPLLLKTPVSTYWRVSGVSEFFINLNQTSQLDPPDGLLSLRCKDGVCMNWQVIAGEKFLTFFAASVIKRSKVPQDNSYFETARSYAWHVKQPTSELEAHLEDLLKAILAPLPAENRLFHTAIMCERVAPLHWWLSQTNYFIRGSAAISDMLSATLFEVHGLRRGPWKPNVNPDVTALITPRIEDYTDKSQSLKGSCRQAAACAPAAALLICPIPPVWGCIRALHLARNRRLGSVHPLGTGSKYSSLLLSSG